MRVTIAIDEDVLALAKTMATKRGCSLGEVISGLVRRELSPAGRPRSRNGIPLLPLKAGAKPVTLALVQALRDGML